MPFRFVQELRSALRYGFRELSISVPSLRLSFPNGHAISAFIFGAIERLIGRLEQLPPSSNPVWGSLPLPE